MKTIFRYANIGLLAAIVALGAVAGFGQDACTDAEGQTKLGDEFRRLFALKDLPSRKTAIETGKQFVEKYGACESAKELADYLKAGLPKMEEKYKQATDLQAREALYKRFDASVKASNFDETYASGKEILAKEPDQLDVVIALGSIGYDESYKGNFKYNDETLRYAKMAIAALESGKVPKTYGLFQWSYKSKENALGWLNYTIGYIIQTAQKNKKEAQQYLYKATQVSSETNKNPIPYELIGNFYFDELNALTKEIKVLADDQKDTDTPEVAKAKVEAIKVKVALANGTAERAMDAFSRAYTFGAAKPYKDKMYKNLQDAYKLRFAKTEGLDAWIASTTAKPMPNPTTAVTPIFDAEPAAPATTTTTTTTSTTPPVAPAVKPGPATTVKPTPAPGTKPSGPATAKPASGMKPQAVVKKPLAAKRKGV